MNRRDLLLAVLAAAEGRPYAPVQIQKAVFLVTKNAPGLITKGKGFEFVPYDYGPFCADVYSEAEELSGSDEAVIAPSSAGRWKTYAASASGLTRGQSILKKMPPDVRGYVTTVAHWVQSQPFGTLVRSIYEAYPEMRANSIFRG